MQKSATTEIGSIPADRAVNNSQRAALAVDCAALSADGLVAVEGAVENRQVTQTEDAATVIAGDLAARDRQVGHDQRIACLNIEDPAVVISADSQTCRGWPLNRQVLIDYQLARGQSNRTGDVARSHVEGDGAVRTGIQNGLPQRARAAVGARRHHPSRGADYEAGSISRSARFIRAITIRVEIDRALICDGMAFSPTLYGCRNGYGHGIHRGDNAIPSYRVGGDRGRRDSAAGIRRNQRQVGR